MGITSYATEVDASDEQSKLEECRRLFELAYDHHYTWLQEVEKDEEFRHGKQWDQADIDFLRRNRRPALTFNVIGAKIAHLLGTAADNDVTPVIEATGKKGRFLAEACNRMLDELREQLEMQSIEEEAFEAGVTVGIGHIAIDAYPDPEDPMRVKMEVFRPHPSEVLWDPASELKDRRDARYMCWSRWLSKSEFRSSYPEKASRADEIFKAYAGGVDPFRHANMDTQVLASPSRDGYVDGLHRYWNAKTRQIRVVRIEVKKAERVTFAIAPDGRRRQIDPRSRSIIAEQAGAGEVQFVEVWQDRMYWHEFCGTELLYSDESPVPFSGFSVASFVYEQDNIARPYGIVRPLRDPQSEVNKRYSQVLNLISNQAAPGVIAEADAIVDQNQFEEATKRPGGVAYVKKGALAGGQVIQRQPQTFPEAVARLQQMGMQMIDLISNVYTDELAEPRGIPEAAATTQLKHRRSMLSMRPVLSRFHKMKKEVASKLFETIIRSYPNEQILELLGSEDRFQMENRTLIDAETGESADFDTVRSVNAKMRFEPAEQNNTSRLLEQNSLMMLMQAGQPVDPSVIFDMLALPESVKDQLKAFARSAAQRNAQLEDTQLQVARDQIEREFQLDVERASTDRERDAAKSKLTAMKTALEFQTRFIDLWIKADESEKNRIASIFDTLVSNATERQRMAMDAKRASSAARSGGEA